MELYINSEKTMFEIENEKNSFDIVHALSDIFAKQKSKEFITKIIINDIEFSFADEEKLKKFSFDKISKLEIETSDIYGITILSLDQIKNFISLLFNIYSKKEANDVLKNMEDYIVWMKKGISQIFNIFPEKEKTSDKEKDFNDKCDNLIEIISKNNNGNLSESQTEKILAVINNLNEDLTDIRKWLIETYKLPDREFIQNNLKKTINDIDVILPKLETIPVLFQSGEDKETMNIIQTLTDILEKSISMFILFKETFKLHMDKFTVKEVTFELFFKTITDHLKQLMDALQNNDSVMIADLLEYEFIPNLNEIKSILLKIEEEAFNKIN